MLSKFAILTKESLSKFKSRSDIRQIVTNTAWLFTDKILRMGASLFVGVWVARYLGTEQYGTYNYAYAFVVLFSPIAKVGLDNVVVRQIVNDPSNKNKILGTTFWLKLLGGILALLLTIICAAILNPNDQQTLKLISVLSTIGIFQAVDTIDFWFKSQVQSKYTVIAKNIGFFIVTLLKITLITIKAPLIAFAIVTSGEFLLSAIGLIIIYRHQGHLPKLWCWSNKTAKYLLSQSLPLIFSSIAVIIYMKVDQIMLGEILGKTEVGLYSAAVRISEVWYFIPVAIVSSVSPSIYSAKEKSEQAYYKKIEKLLRLLVFIALIIILPMTLLSDKIIAILFGNGYSASASVLTIHIWASVFVFLGTATSPWFIAEGLTHLSMFRTMVGAICNIILNIILIPSHGINGAAIATLTSQVFATFICHAIHPATRKLFLIQAKSMLLFI